MTGVSFSIPWPSTSKACGMLPAFANVNVTVPAAMAGFDSSTFHSDSLASTATTVAGVRSAEGRATERAATNAPTTVRWGMACVGIICDLPRLGVYQQVGSLQETSRIAGLFHRG